MQVFSNGFEKVVYCLYSIMPTFQPIEQKTDPKTKHVFYINVSQYSIYISNKCAFACKFSSSIESLTSICIQRRHTYKNTIDKQLGEDVVELLGKTKVTATPNLGKSKITQISQWWAITLQQKSYLCIPLLGIARPPSEFLHACVCERFIVGDEHCLGGVLQKQRRLLRAEYVTNNFSRRYTTQQ